MTAPATTPHTAEDVRRATGEKRSVAASSVLAAVALTGMKLVVGFATGSLGILSEAAHSGLDLVAAVVTLFAVRVSGRPADREHTYGHGKIENLSALFETALLMATCMWIIVEAVQRLFIRTVHVEATAWSFVIMVISIIIDFSRSRALFRVAKKYHSQALEADALHFSTDIWSSGVVILGLIGVRLSSLPGLEWLLKADAVAALGVAAIVVWITYRMGRKTIGALLDEVPPGLRDDLAQALRIPGVKEVVRVRVRRSGPEAFADVTFTVDRGTSVERAHVIATEAETVARQLLPGADVVVHVEPADTIAADVAEDAPGVVRAIASRMGLSAHDIKVEQVLGAHSLELHLEVDDSLNVAVAHEQATAFEKALRDAFPGLGQIVTHIEPSSAPRAGHRARAEDEALVMEVLHRLTTEDDLECHPHDLSVRWSEGGLAVSFHCAIGADTAITAAHALTERVERALRAKLPNLGRVVIHVEPIAKSS